MATIKVLLDKRRAAKKGCYPLVIRVYSGRKQSDIGLKIHLKDSQFDEESQQVKRNHPNYKVINSKIKETSLKLETATLKLQMKEEDISAEKIKSTVVKPVVKLSFVEYGETIVTQMRAVNRLGNALAYEGALNALKTYSGKSNLLFNEVNYELITKLENKMMIAGLKRNSIAAYNRSLRAIFNRAINEDLVEAKFYPYRKYKIKGEATAKRNISKEDIKAISEMELQQDSQQWHSRNYFILSFNLRGISFADMASIRPSDIFEGRLTYIRKKTHKHYNIKLTEKAKEILCYASFKR
jgi:integrase/recombinase XerD